MEESATEKIVSVYETPRRKKIFLSINISIARLFYLEFNFFIHCFLITSSKSKTIQTLIFSNSSNSDMIKVEKQLELSSYLMTYRNLLQVVDISFLLSTMFAPQGSLQNPLGKGEQSQGSETSVFTENCSWVSENGLPILLRTTLKRWEEQVSSSSTGRDSVSIVPQET